MTIVEIDKVPEGVERHAPDRVVDGHAALDGWAVYSGCEGDSPTLRGFFLDEHDAHVFAEANDRLAHGEDEPERLCVDPVVVPAILTDKGIYTANDYAIETPHELRARVFK